MTENVNYLTKHATNDKLEKPFQIFTIVSLFSVYLVSFAGIHFHCPSL